MIIAWWQGDSSLDLLNGLVIVDTPQTPGDALGMPMTDSAAGARETCEF